ncbi:transposase-like protein [Sphingopyxis italica]|uniref:Transposase-like protein n=1 Tax=Sphingopyxis italica TaxID=1129133 RepID=A0A7X5XUQ8_9SPHN|nr:IS1595 family transposase [Sphingopyxis italica]NJB91363.1 transposase-like protein [Sphingopyxis italica]
MSKKPLTTTQFFRLFPDDETCLTHLFNVRFGQGFECPSCERPSNWYRIKAERAYSCQWCGHHLHPTVGTPFEQTRTPLQLWFYAIHLFTTTRHGVSAKELERQLGVTYKTAWRMATLIRQHMADVDGSGPVGGEGVIVEIDETLVGGSVSGKGSGYKGNKTVVVGMLERGGDVVTQVVSSRHRKPMEALIQANVTIGTTIATDEFGSYRFLNQLGYDHMTVQHNKGQYAASNGASVNAIEGFWRHLKCSISGTHVSVSPKYLGRYAKEFEFRFNRRNDPASMLPELLSTFRPLTAKSR